MHRLLGLLAWKSHSFGKLVKGHHQVLVKNGKILWEEMSKQNISKGDIEEAIRRGGNVTEIESVKYAFLERSGDISIIPKEKNMREEPDQFEK